jgi:hypothetical protein
MSLKTCVFVLAIFPWWLAHITALAREGGTIKCANGATISASVPSGGCVVTGQKIECSNKSGDKAIGDCATLSCASAGNGSCSKTHAAVGTTKPTPLATNPTSVVPLPKHRPSTGVLEEHPASGDGNNH